MDYIYFGIKLPSKQFDRIRVDNVNFNENSSALKQRVSEIIVTKDEEEITLVYCSNILEDDEPLNKYNLHAGSTVHVLRKIVDEPVKEFKTKFTEIDVARVCSMYRSLNSGNFHVS